MRLRRKDEYISISYCRGAKSGHLRAMQYRKLVDKVMYKKHPTKGHLTSIV
jgi:hypothetical protein